MCHLSKNMNLQNWPLVTWPWPRLCKLSPKSVRYTSLSIIVEFCMQNGPKTCIAWPHWGTKIWWPLVTWSWPDPVMSPAQWSQRTLICAIEGLPWSIKPHSLLCLVFVARRIQKKNTLLTFDLSSTWPLTWNLSFKHSLELSCSELSNGVCPVPIGRWVQEITGGGGNIYPPSAARSAGDLSAARVNVWFVTS